MATAAESTDDAVVIVVSAAPRPAVAERYVEMCEHKGIGHPDTITDAVCEAAACELASVYRKEFGQVLHFNVDKGLLVAGRSEPRFGGGRITKPPRLIVCGRTVNPGGRLDVRTIVTDAVRRYLERNIRADTRAFSIEAAIEDGSRSLQQVFANQHEIARANDTSFGVGFAPLSTLEQKVLHSAAILRSAEFRAAFPAAGDDFKIMGLRIGAVLAFTVAIAMIDRHVESVAHYFNIKRQVHAYLADRLGEGCTLHLNALDDPDARDESGVYLTVSGLSAEMGDDGQVGRGNRVNGLITPGRAMSLEAAAGKNPAAHVGKIYSVLAHRLAAAICTQIPGVTDVTVQLLSRIGQPIDRPQMAVVELRASGGITAELQANVEAVVTDRFRHIADLTGQLASGAFPVY